MSKSSVPSVIRLKGVRHNNLKNFDLDLPIGELIVVTGVSGSGKSSLAFDTLYAEGQRRYIETFSPYARQFFDRMDKPQVDSIQGIPPAIAIEQRNSVKSTRSTVGTMTEICDYMKLVWSHLAQLHCRVCGEAVRKDSPSQIWDLLTTAAQDIPEQSEVLITFELALSDKISLVESLALVSKQGYQRLLVLETNASSPVQNPEPQILRIEEAVHRLEKAGPRHLTIVQDRLKLEQANRARFVEACEQAYHFGKGKLTVHNLHKGGGRKFSSRFHCARCDLEYREPTTALFSFNNPIGACPSCRGFGRTITIDYDLAIPDRSLSLAGGAVKPWQSGQSAECQQDLLKYCRLRHVPADIPFHELSSKWQEWVIQGDADYGKDPEHEWPRAWYGVKGYFRWLESKAYKMHVRVLLSRYRAYKKCDDCQGRRLQPEALLFRLSTAKGNSITLADFYQLSVRDAFDFVSDLASNMGQGQPPSNLEIPGSKKSRLAAASPHQKGIRGVRKVSPVAKETTPVGKRDPLALAIEEVRSRLSYLNEAGVGYLTLDRPTRTLSGGETERVNLTTCLGSRLVNTMFVLDEPSVGLHSRDTVRLINILQRLRDAGNTVIVVEHEASVMRAADQIVDLGPGHGEAGGSLVFQGSFQSILKSPLSLTGQYLSGGKQIKVPPRRKVNSRGKRITLRHARLHNLKDLTVEIPLARLVCITGVSGSGKTTLVRDVLLPCLHAALKGSEVRGQESEIGAQSSEAESSDDTQNVRTSGLRPLTSALSGAKHLGGAVLVDQAPLGKTPRSNPAVYIGAFEHIRELFAETDLAHRRGLGASAFSFNSAQGQCPLCRGAGFEKIEMQFLSDIYIRCSECQGRRYRPHILEVKLSVSSPFPATPKSPIRKSKANRPNVRTGAVEWSIADLLEATVDEAIQFLAALSESRPAQRSVQSLKLLQEVGLGYLRVGQPINTLSGGESQRLKLVSYLADFAETNAMSDKPTLFLFDEPTTGLHFDDIGILLRVFQRFVDAGHSVVVIEHNMDVIKSADWLIDLGPEAGRDGGEIVAQGPPEEVARCRRSHTGQVLDRVLNSTNPIS
jgi:excinuclease ABC subunit A